MKLKLPDQYDFDSCADIAMPVGFFVFCVFTVCLVIGWIAVKIVFFTALAVLFCFGFVFAFAWLFAFAVVNYEAWHDSRDEGPRH